MGESLFSEISSGDEKCLALFKVAREEGVGLPVPSVHIYLAWILEMPNDGGLLKVMSEHAVSSSDELEKVVEENRNSISPNALPYLVGRASGDFATSYNSLMGESGRNVGFPAMCYSVAGFHGGKMGRREESQVFGLLALDLGRYIDLLKRYHSRVREDSDFEVTKEDCLAFKKYLGSEEKRVEIVIPKKKKKSGGLLI